MFIDSILEAWDALAPEERAAYVQQEGEGQSGIPEKFIQETMERLSSK